MQNVKRWGDIYFIHKPVDKHCVDNTYDCDCSWKTKKCISFKSDYQLTYYDIRHLKTFNVSCNLFKRRNICSIITVSVIITTIWSGRKRIINALDNWNNRITYVLLIAGVLQAFKGYQWSVVFFLSLWRHLKEDSLCAAIVTYMW